MHRRNRWVVPLAQRRERSEDGQCGECNVDRDECKALLADGVCVVRTLTGTTITTAATDIAVLTLRVRRFHC